MITCASTRDDAVEMLTGYAIVLLVENVKRAADYYRDRLGFAISLLKQVVRAPRANFVDLL